MAPAERPREGEEGRLPFNHALSWAFPFGLAAALAAYFLTDDMNIGLRTGVVVSFGVALLIWNGNRTRQSRAGSERDG